MARGDTYAAVVARHQAGITPVAIAAELGLTDKAVYYHLNKLKRRGGEPPVPRPEPEPKLALTPLKVAKARRIFDKSMLVIAEALGVPLGDLLRLVRDDLNNAEDERAADELLLGELASSSGPVQPQEEGEEDADADAAEDEPEAGPVGQEDEAPRGGRGRSPRTLPPVVESRRASVTAGVSPEPEPRFKLHNELGEYLHQHGRGMTRLSAFMWRGSAEDVRKLKQRKPNLRDLIEKEC